MPKKPDTMLKRELTLEALKQELPIGQSCTVRAQRGEKAVLYSSIQDLNDEGILISLPSDDRGIPVLIRNGEVIEISLISGLGRIGFLAEVEGQVKEPLPMLKLHAPTNIFKAELRKYYRVPVHLPLSAFKATEISDATGNTKWVKDFSVPPEEARILGTILDISGGGIYAVTKSDIEKKGTVLLDISVSGEFDLRDIASRIARKSMTNTERKLWGYGMEFLNIDEKEREKVVRYVFKRQRELRGLLA